MSETGDLYVVKPDGTSERRILASGDATVDAQFSPDGHRLVFATDQGEGARNIAVMNADGSSHHQVTPTQTSDAARADTWEFPSWLPDGSGLRFYRNARQDALQGL